MRLRGKVALSLRARAFGEDAGMGGIAQAVRRAAVTDDVVVEHGDDVPALRLRVVREHLAPHEPLLLARQSSVDDGAGELALGEDARRLDDRGGARAVVV